MCWSLLNRLDDICNHQWCFRFYCILNTIRVKTVPRFNSHPLYSALVLYFTLFVTRFWTWRRHWRTGRAPSSWCRCRGWWWSAAAQAARGVWSHLAMPSHKPSTASAPFSPLGSHRWVRRGSWGETSATAEVRKRKRRLLIFLWLEEKWRGRHDDWKWEQRICTPAHSSFCEESAEKHGTWRDWHTSVSQSPWGCLRLPRWLDWIIGFSTELGFVYC